MGTLREKIRFWRKVWFWVEIFLLTTNLEPCCLRANWVMGFCLFYLFWGAVQCVVWMFCNCWDFEEGWRVGSWEEKKDIADSSRPIISISCVNKVRQWTPFTFNVLITSWSKHSHCFLGLCFSFFFFINSWIWKEIVSFFFGDNGFKLPIC